MKDMNETDEVNSRLKQLKTSVKVENRKKNNTKIIANSLKSKFVYNLCDTNKTLKSRFVYKVCGYHHTPIPPQVTSKVKFAHPSPLFGLLSVYKRLLSNDNLVLRLGKLTACIKWLSMQLVMCVCSLLYCLRKNMNNSQSVTTSTNDTSSDKPDNECNLQSINIENQLYESRLNDYTYNNMILSNITK